MFGNLQWASFLSYIRLDADFCFRHALDIRLMTDDRAAIFDASYSFHPGKKDSSGDISMSEPTTSDSTLKPIPDYSTIVFDCVREALASESVVHGKIAPVDVAVVCDKSFIGPLIRAVYTATKVKLQKSSS